MRGSEYDPPTEKQKAMLKTLTLSACFTEAEAEATAKWLESTLANKLTASVLIDRALKRIAERKGRRKAAEARQQARRDKVERKALAETARHAIFEH